MKTCKLYELPRDTNFYLQGTEYKFHNVDGMYSYCTTLDTKEVFHLAAWTEVQYNDVPSS